ncbi:MAG: sigma factor [Nocardioides sp.]
MNTDQDFAEFVGARWASLYRLAYLLSASPTGAEDLLQTTLEKAYVNWPRISGMEFPEAYVRRMLANTLVSGRRRAWIGEQPWAELPETAGACAEVPVLDRSLIWPLVCALPDRQRAGARGGRRPQWWPTVCGIDPMITPVMVPPAVPRTGRDGEVSSTTTSWAVPF